MQRLMQCCARGALGLGAAALLLTGVPALADPGAGDWSRESRALRLAQAKPQPEAAGKPEPQRRLEQQEGAKKMQQPERQQSQPEMKRMRRMPEAAPAAQSPKSRFGAGVIRGKETVDGD